MCDVSNHGPAPPTHLLLVGLGVCSWTEQSQGGPQEPLVDLHRHLLNQSHEVPEVHTTSSALHQNPSASSRQQDSKSNQLRNQQVQVLVLVQVTHLNCMTLLCRLNLVMTDTSMNGFGSVETTGGSESCRYTSPNEKEEP